MHITGWFRLWIVVTVIAVPAFSLVGYNQQKMDWDNLNKAIIKNCVDAEFDQRNHPDALECGRKQGTLKTVFEREGTTP